MARSVAQQLRFSPRITAEEWFLHVSSRGIDRRIGEDKIQRSDREVGASRRSDRSTGRLVDRLIFSSQRLVAPLPAVAGEADLLRSDASEKFSPVIETNSTEIQARRLMILYLPSISSLFSFRFIDWRPTEPKCHHRVLWFNEKGSRESKESWRGSFLTNLFVRDQVLYKGVFACSIQVVKPMMGTTRLLVCSIHMAEENGKETLAGRSVGWSDGRAEERSGK